MVQLTVLFHTLLILSLGANAQNRSIDSLELALKKHRQTDTVQVNLLNELAYEYRNADINKTLIYASRADSLSGIINYRKGKADSQRNLGLHFWFKSNYSKAISHYQVAVDIYTEINSHEGLSACYNNMGFVYYAQAMYLEALEYHHKSLKIREETGDKKGSASSYHSIGAIYAFLEDYPRATSYFDKYSMVSLEIGDSSALAYYYLNIGGINFKQENFDEAQAYFVKALNKLETEGNKTVLTRCLNNMGDVSININNPVNALNYYSKALGLSREIGNRWSEARSIAGLGSVNFAQGNFNLALKLSLKANSIAREIGHAELAMKTFETLSKTHSALGQYQKAYSYHLQFKSLSDSIRNDRNTKRIIGLEYEYTFQREKEAEIALLEQEKKDALYESDLRRQRTIRNALIGGFAMLAALLIVLTLSVKRIRKSNRLLKAKHDEVQEKNLELTQLNADKDRFTQILAHDLKNPFNSMLGLTNFMLQNFEELTREEHIKYLGVVNQSTKKTYKLLEDLLLWSKCQNGGLAYTPQELDLPLLCQDILTENKHSAEQKEISLTHRNSSLPPLYGDENMLRTVLRNLVSNAIKFTYPKGEVSINLKHLEHEVWVQVLDNGVGIPPENLDKLWSTTKPITTRGTQNESGSGLGLLICKEIIEKHGGRIWVESEPSKGSVFSFSIPKHRKN